MKKVKFQEGDVFLVPLENENEYAIGFLAIKNGTIGLGYFFDQKVSGVNDEAVHTFSLDRIKILLIREFGCLVPRPVNGA